MIGSFGSSEFGSNEFLLPYSMAHGVGKIKEAIAGLIMINYKRAASVQLAALCFVGQELLVKRINFEF